VADVVVRAGVCMSVPRYGSLSSAETIFEISAFLSAPRFVSGGAWWEQGLTASIEAALVWQGEDGSPLDTIICFDYDTFATVGEISELLKWFYANPSLDCVAPMQAKRGVTTELLANTDGEVDFRNPLIPIATAHFGMTAFRRRVFEGLKKPWFLGRPNDNGDWKDGRVDADIYFWRNFAECGFKAAVATQVVVGHGEDAVVYPRLINGKFEKVYLPVQEWMKRREAPEGVGVVG
jgi:hypothetical protein